jgi:hypothetical protein
MTPELRFALLVFGSVMGMGTIILYFALGRIFHG